MADLKLTRSIAILGFQFITEVVVEEVAIDDDSGAAVYLTQSWNPDHQDADDREDSVHLTWAEWCELRDHVDAARQVMPGPLADAAIVCGFQWIDGDDRRECCLVDEHPHQQSWHIDRNGNQYHEVPF